MQWDVGKALFLTLGGSVHYPLLTLSEALEQGMIGEDKDFFREGLLEVEGH